MLNREMAENFLGIIRPTYAWVIDTWPDVEDIGPMGDGEVAGPSDAPDPMLDQLRAGNGERFRMFDDDGIEYCRGRFAVDTTNNPDPDEDAGDPRAFPLYDYGEGGLGCVRIEYWLKDETSGNHRWVEVQ